jgi:hypothetical protein
VDKPELLVDPAVSREKFEREIALYRQLEDEHFRHGRWILKAEFPEVFVVFAVPQVKPPSILFGAIIDFTNYDLWPPSVRFVDPFTKIAYKGRELPNRLSRMVPIATPPEAAALGLVAQPQEQFLLQFHDPEDVPFLCLAGVREYHDHPGHTGDDWFLHRGKGEGTLYFLLNTIYRYGVAPMNGYSMEMRLAITGYTRREIPE